MTLSSAAQRSQSMLMKESCWYVRIIYRLQWCFHPASVTMGFPKSGAAVQGFAETCHGFGSESAWIYGLMNMPVHPKVVDWMDRIIVGYVLIISSNLKRLKIFGPGSKIATMTIVDTAPSYSILVLMVAMRRIQILAHVWELNWFLKKGQRIIDLVQGLIYVDVLEIDLISQRGDDASALVRTVETGT